MHAACVRHSQTSTLEMLLKHTKVWHMADGQISAETFNRTLPARVILRLLWFLSLLEFFYSSHRERFSWMETI